MSLINSLIEFYHKESWHKERLSDYEIGNYYREMIAEDRIIPCIDGGKLLGYCEWTRINLAQLGYIAVTGIIRPDLWDQNGLIAYVSNMYIDEPYRKVGIVQYFKKKLIELNPKAIYIAGCESAKRHRPLAIFKVRKKGALIYG